MSTPNNTTHAEQQVDALQTVAKESAEEPVQNELQNTPKRKREHDAEEATGRAEEVPASLSKKSKIIVENKFVSNDTLEPQASLQVGKAYQQDCFMHIIQHMDRDRVVSFQVRIEEYNGKRVSWKHRIAGGCTVSLPYDFLNSNDIMEPSQPQMVNIISAIDVSNTQEAIEWIVSQGKKEILLSYDYPFRVIKPEQ